MSYAIRGGKLVKRERLHKREPEREPIKTPYCRELWVPGPIQRMARTIARAQLEREMRAKGQDPRDASEKQMENGVTVLLFGSGEFYLNKAKEALR